MVVRIGVQERGRINEQAVNHPIAVGGCLFFAQGFGGCLNLLQAFPEGRAVNGAGVPLCHGLRIGQVHQGLQQHAAGGGDGVPIHQEAGAAAGFPVKGHVFIRQGGQLRKGLGRFIKAPAQFCPNINEGALQAIGAGKHGKRHRIGFAVPGDGFLHLGVHGFNLGHDGFIVRQIHNPARLNQLVQASLTQREEAHVPFVFRVCHVGIPLAIFQADVFGMAIWVKGQVFFNVQPVGSHSLEAGGARLGCGQGRGLRQRGLGGNLCLGGFRQAGYHMHSPLIPGQVTHRVPLRVQFHPGDIQLQIIGFRALDASAYG